MRWIGEHKTGFSIGQTLITRQLLLTSFPVFAILLLSHSVKAQEQIGNVLEINGRWVLEQNSSEALSQGQSLPAGGIIRAQSPSTGNRIVIVSPGGKVLEHRQCNASGCGRPIYLPKSFEPESAAEDGLVGGLMKWILGEPKRYSSSASRGGTLADAVVLLKDGYLDLTPTFKKSSKDVYYFRLRTIPGKDVVKEREILGPYNFAWDPAKPLPALTNGLKPGLYEIGLLERSGDEYESTGMRAWVLVSDPAQYPKNAGAFQRAVMIASKWGPEVEPDTVRSFLRAGLDQLAASKTK